MEGQVGNESNDNLPPQIGEWVTIERDEPERLSIGHYLRTKPPFVIADIKRGVAKLVARGDYKKGMNIPETVLEIVSSTVPVYGVPLKKLRIVPKPQVIEGKSE